MYRENRLIDALKMPNDDAIIWRYMDFTKFVSLLESSELYFNRSDKFDDPFEGSFPETECSSMETEAEIYKSFRMRTFINCWHLNDFESDAMWRLYAQKGEGIAILSTIGRLKESLIDDRIVNIGRVKYIDYQSDKMYKGDFFSPFFHKRYSFAHENEIRAITVDEDTDIPMKDGKKDYLQDVFPCGIRVKISLSILIQSIYVAPFSPSWFLQLVRSIVNKYDYYHLRVNQSELIKKPTF